jgi:hypothetical protein
MTDDEMDDMTMRPEPDCYKLVEKEDGKTRDYGTIGKITDSGVDSDVSCAEPPYSAQTY